MNARKRVQIGRVFDHASMREMGWLITNQPRWKKTLLNGLLDGLMSMLSWGRVLDWYGGGRLVWW